MHYLISSEPYLFANMILLLHIELSRDRVLGSYSIPRHGQSVSRYVTNAKSKDLRMSEFQIILKDYN